MTAAAPLLQPIGRERQPLTLLDDFAAEPDDLRRAAAAAAFGPAANHYPGIRADLPAGYLDAQWPAITAAIAAAYDHRGPVRLIDASFSVVTTPADALSVRQRLPHCDAFGADRVAMVHYLSRAGGDGTAFFRHRSTGFETIDERRAPIFFDQLDAELRHGGIPRGYVAGDTPLFERTFLAEGRYNRAVLYRSALLHSGAIDADGGLSADPLAGRLTVTAFFAMA